MTKVTKLAVLIVGGLLASGTWAQTDGAARTNQAPADSKSVAGPDYVIGADDNLHIAVWKEPDLTASLPVRPDGKISLPLLNDVPAAGLTPMQLADSITKALTLFIPRPAVSVLVREIHSI